MTGYLNKNGSGATDEDSNCLFISVCCADDLEIQSEMCNDDSNLEMDKCTHESLLQCN